MLPLDPARFRAGIQLYPANKKRQTRKELRRVHGLCAGARPVRCPAREVVAARPPGVSHLALPRRGHTIKFTQLTPRLCRMREQ